MVALKDNKIAITGSIGFMIAIVFLLDIFFPLGIIVWVFYLIPISIAAATFKARISLGIIGICIVLLFSLVILRPSGMVTLMEYSIFNRTMGVVVFLFTHFLITVLVQTRKKVNTVNQRFNIAIKSAAAGVWDFDVRNNINTWDDAMFKLYKIKRDTFTNAYDSWKSLLDHDDAERAIRVFNESLYGNGDYDDVFSIKRGDGENRFIRSICKIDRNHKGEPLRAIGINIDITDQKNAEDTMQKLNDNLLRSNKELENFAYIASHDLQEPLRMITSFSQLLEKRYYDKLDQEAHEFIEFIVGGASHMQRLIKDLLEYSRITTQAGILKEIDINISVKRAIDNLQIKIESCQAVVTTDELPVIYGDEVHLVRLFQNLIDNALKFTENGNPKVEIHCKPGFNAWIFSVKDNGIGIDKKNQDRIFDIFQRLNSRDKYPGTGIGLAICKKIVEQHGGKIWLESEPGKGTTFFFTIKK